MSDPKTPHQDPDAVEGKMTTAFTWAIYAVSFLIFACGVWLTAGYRATVEDSSRATMQRCLEAGGSYRANWFETSCKKVPTP